MANHVVLQVPQIFVCGEWLGGCQETKQLLASGVLEEKLKKCCGGDVKCDRDRREYL